MLIEQKFYFDANCIVPINGGYRLDLGCKGETSHFGERRNSNGSNGNGSGDYPTGEVANSRRHILFLMPKELFLSEKDIIELKINSVALFSLSEFYDSTLGALAQTPLFCRTVREYEKGILKRKSPEKISECIDDMKTLCLMFSDCKKTSAILNENLKVLIEIFHTTAQR